MRELISAATLVILLGWAQAATATPIIAAGTFFVTFTSGGALSGSFTTGVFNDSVVTGGNQMFDVPLSSLAVATPTGFVFDTTNSGALFLYSGGSLSGVVVGGLVGGVDAIGLTDDFLVRFGPTGALSVASLRAGPVILFAQTLTGTVSVAPVASADVPEPASLLLIGTGLAWLAARRSRRRARE